MGRSGCPGKRVYCGPFRKTAKETHTRTHTHKQWFRFEGFAVKVSTALKKKERKITCDREGVPPELTGMSRIWDSCDILRQSEGVGVRKRHIIKAAVRRQITVKLLYL